jgi:DNA invertase Pin-like site-specific DNA recombinase
VTLCQTLLPFLQSHVGNRPFVNIVGTTRPDRYLTETWLTYRAVSGRSKHDFVILADTTLPCSHPCRAWVGMRQCVFIQDLGPETNTREKLTMAINQVVTYCRVSTQRQGASGLGLEAQRQSVMQYISRNSNSILAEFVEVETGTGANALEKRPELRKALELCRKTGATLLIAKLDRLARNVHFVSGLIETGVDFIAADMPNANKSMHQMHAVMSEWERDQISDRTKAALAAAKARGVVLGATGPANLKRNTLARQDAARAFHARLKPVTDGFISQGMTRRAIVVQLNALDIKAPKGGAWSLGQVQRTVVANR